MFRRSAASNSALASIVGDVIVEDDDIYGDGVNVAARLESIAAPGGVAISGAVRDHLGNRLDLAFEDCGEQTLKNIERPVRVYRRHARRTPLRVRPSIAAARERRSGQAVDRRPARSPI